MSRRLLFVVSAPSGGGKTSLCERAAASVPDLVHSVSYTTRALRPDEQNGTDYHFVDVATFRRMIAAGEFAEWAEVHGHLYGTSRPLLEGTLAAGKDVVLDIDTQGAAQIRRAYPESVSVFVVPPTWEQLEARLRDRGTEGEEEIGRRMRRAREEVREYPAYGYVIVNDRFEKALQELVAVITAERCRSARADLSFLSERAPQARA